MTMLSVSLLSITKNFYKIEPEDAQSRLAFVLVPWSFKFIYGIITDIVPLCGSRKKHYIILCAIVQFLSPAIAATARFENILPFIVCGGTLMGAFSIMDTVIDGLMVSESRKDPQSGSDDL